MIGEALKEKKTSAESPGSTSARFDFNLKCVGGKKAFTCGLKTGTSIQGCVWRRTHHMDPPRDTNPKRQQTHAVIKVTIQWPPTCFGLPHQNGAAGKSVDTQSHGAILFTFSRQQFLRSQQRHSCNFKHLFTLYGSDDKCRDSVGETVKNSAGIKRPRLKPVRTRFGSSLGMQRGEKYSMPYGLDSLETFQMANGCNQCLWSEHRGG